MDINVCQKNDELVLHVKHDGIEYLFTPFEIFCIFKGSPGEMKRLERALMGDKAIVGDKAIMKKLADRIEMHLKLKDKDGA